MTLLYHLPRITAGRPRFYIAADNHCLRHAVPFFFKQWGGRAPKKVGRLLDGRTWDEMPAEGTEREEASA